MKRRKSLNTVVAVCAFLAVLATIPGGICCDFDHIKTGPFRVAIPDLNILRQYINKPLGQVPMCDESPLYTGPYNFWRSP